MVQTVFDMGQHSSLPKSGRRRSLRSLQRRSSSHKGNLSHTFTLNDIEDKMELLNINQASEEELMTLHGVTRDIARSIVEHRKAIGRFRKVEDLALVRGIGANRLQQIRPEICVTTRRQPSGASSRAQSYDSLRSTDSKATVRSLRQVNINKASVFELQCVHGITQEIAAAIVHYREKKGPFKQVEDLQKVKGIDRIRLHSILRFLTVDNTPVDQDSDQDQSRPQIITNGFHLTAYDRRLNGGPPKLAGLNGLSQSSLVDIFELLSAYSPRPILEEFFSYTRNGEAAFRVGSWNLHGFTMDKASNPGVREVVCRTILENGLSIVAVQEIVQAEALRLLCDELNGPKLRRISEWKDKNHNWNFCMLNVEGSQLGFIYDSDGAVDLELISLDQGPSETKDDCDVIIGTFKVAELNLQLVNLKLTNSANLHVINDKIRDLISEEDLLLVLVDFSGLTSTSEDWLKVGGLQATFPLTTTTHYSGLKSDTYPNHISNILYSSKVKGQLTGINNVIRQGLTHLAIPNGWNWGGPASPFCPVWVELYQNNNVGTAL